MYFVNACNTGGRWNLTLPDGSDALWANRPNTFPETDRCVIVQVFAHKAELCWSTSRARGYLKLTSSLSFSLNNESKSCHRSFGLKHFQSKHNFMTLYPTSHNVTVSLFLSRFRFFCLFFPSSFLCVILWLNYNEVKKYI